MQSKKLPATPLASTLYNRSGPRIVCELPPLENPCIFVTIFMYRASNHIYSAGASDLGEEFSQFLYPI